MQNLCLFFSHFQMEKKCNFEIHHATSFGIYVLAKRSKLVTSYPFLSNEQINRKLKEAWNRLSDEDKKVYSKSTVKLTPVKQTPRSTEKRKRQSKGKTSPQARKKDDTPCIPATPEYVNTRKLKDFRETHSEINYKNDFDDEDCVAFKPAIDSQNVWSTTYPSKHVEMPAELETPVKQGILKPRYQHWQMTLPIYLNATVTNSLVQLLSFLKKMDI